MEYWLPPACVPTSAADGLPVDESAAAFDPAYSPVEDGSGLPDEVLGYWLPPACVPPSGGGVRLLGDTHRLDARAASAPADAPVLDVGADVPDVPAFAPEPEPLAAAGAPALDGLELPAFPVLEVRLDGAGVAADGLTRLGIVE